MPPSLVLSAVVFSALGFALPFSQWPVIPFALGLMAVARQDLSRVGLSVIRSPLLSRPEIEDVQLDNHPDGLLWRFSEEFLHSSVTCLAAYVEFHLVSLFQARA